MADTRSNNRHRKTSKGQKAESIRRAKTSISKCSWWATEPRLGRVAHGVAHRVDRLKAIGNGQIPLVVSTAWQILSDD